MTRVMTATTAAGASPLTLFPNGCVFNATDAFVGSGRIHEISLTFDVSGGTPFGPLALTVYDAITVATQRMVIGGTANPESYRVIAGTMTLSPHGEPIVEGAVNAQVSGLRELLSKQLSGDGRVDHIRIPCDLDCIAGMVVSLDTIGIPCTVQVNFTPWVSGGARRRRAYRPGSTTKVLSPAQTNIPL